MVNGNLNRAERSGQILVMFQCVDCTDLKNWMKRMRGKNVRCHEGLLCSVLDLNNLVGDWDIYPDEKIIRIDESYLKRDVYWISFSEREV